MLQLPYDVTAVQLHHTAVKGETTSVNECSMLLKNVDGFLPDYVSKPSHPRRQ
jgi:hypothetical protein